MVPLVRLQADREEEECAPGVAPVTSEKNSPKPKRKYRFQPGTSGNPAGRPKGVPNKATHEIKVFATSILDSPEYRENFEVRAKAGKLHPTLEQMLYFYRYGKPKEVVQLEGSESLSELLDIALSRRNGQSGE